MNRVMSRSAVLAVVLWCAPILHANWISIDNFNDEGVLGEPAWLQTLPTLNFHTENGRLRTDGKAMALHQEYPFAEAEHRIRFEAYSSEEEVSPQTISAIIGAASPQNYYEVRLLSGDWEQLGFYRMRFYSVLDGVSTLDFTADFDSHLDAVRLDAALDGNTINVLVQPIDRASGVEVGDALSFSFSEVPAPLVDTSEGARIGLAAQGSDVEIDNLEGYVIPEATTLLLAALAYLPLARRRRRMEIAN